MTEPDTTATEAGTTGAPFRAGTTGAPFRAGPAILVFAAAVAVLLIGAGLVIGMQFGDDDDTSDPRGGSAVDVGFLQDMQAHHAQAVEMAVLIRDRTSDEEIRGLALDIELTQQQQIGQMFGLLATWGEPQSNPTPLAWMAPVERPAKDPHQTMEGMDSAPGGVMTMPGMASQADLDRLAGLRGRAAERLFLELMIAHHRGGLPMAVDAAVNADEPWVRTLATRITAAQTVELEALQTLLDARGGPLR